MTEPTMRLVAGGDETGGDETGGETGGVWTGRGAVGRFFGLTLVLDVETVARLPAVFRFPAASFAARARTVATMVPALFALVTLTLNVFRPLRLSIVTFEAVAVPESLTSLAVKPVTGSLNEIVKRTGNREVRLD
jgi:hypothetical protein